MMFAPRDLLAVDLGKLAMRGLLNRNPELDPKDIDYVLFGTVIQARHMRYIKREMHDTLCTLGFFMGRVNPRGSGRVGSGQD